MESTRKNNKITQSPYSISEKLAEIKQNDIKEAKKLSEKTSPGFASFWTGISQEEIVEEAKKQAEIKASHKAYMQKRSEELYKVDNGYLAKIDIDIARKAHGFSKKEIRNILAFRKKENEIQKKNAPSLVSRAYKSLRHFLQPEKEEEEKLMKRQSAIQHREAMRKKYGIK